MSDTLSDDILYTIFNHLSSYKRSTLCTVSKRWDKILCQIVSKPYSSNDDILRAGDYHAFVRSKRSKRDSKLSLPSLALFVMLLRDDYKILPDCLLTDPFYQTHDPIARALYIACIQGNTEIVGFLLNGNIMSLGDRIDLGYYYYLVGLYKTAGCWLTQCVAEMPQGVTKDRIRYYVLCGLCESGTIISINSLDKCLSQQNYTSNQLSMLLAHAMVGKQHEVVKMIQNAKLMRDSQDYQAGIILKE